MAATSLALAAAAPSTGRRYACVFPDALVVGVAEAATARLEGVDLLVVDARRRDAARPRVRGMVVVRHGVGRRRGASMGAGTRVVRSVYLPIGKLGRRGPSHRRRQGAQPADRPERLRRTEFRLDGRLSVLFT
jgi:hypothetical protein